METKKKDPPMSGFWVIMGIVWAIAGILILLGWAWPLIEG